MAIKESTDTSGRWVLHEFIKNQIQHKLETIIYILTVNEIIPFNVMCFLELVFPLRTNTPATSSCRQFPAQFFSFISSAESKPLSKAYIKIYWEMLTQADLTLVSSVKRHPSKDNE